MDLLLPDQIWTSEGYTKLEHYLRDYDQDQRGPNGPDVPSNIPLSPEVVIKLSYKEEIAHLRHMIFVS